MKATEEFNNLFFELANGAVEMANEEVSKLGLSVVLSTSYDFGRRRWVAAYVRSAQKIYEGKILIALNSNAIYEVLKKAQLDGNREEVRVQALVSIMHEVGHGIIDWLRHCLDKTAYNRQILDIIDCSSNYEEHIVEEYALSFISEYSGVYGSRLGDALESLNVPKKITMKQIQEAIVNEIKKVIE